MLYQKFFNKLLFLSWFHTIDWNRLNVLNLWQTSIFVNEYATSREYNVIIWINIHSQFFSDLRVYLVDFHSIFNDQLLFFSLILKGWKTNVKECRNFGAYLSPGEGPNIRKCWFLNLVNWPSDNTCITMGELRSFLDESGKRKRLCRHLQVPLICRSSSDLDESDKFHTDKPVIPVHERIFWSFADSFCAHAP